MNQVQTNIKTMSSSQLGVLLGYDKSTTNRKIKDMFEAEIVGGIITSTNRENNQVSEYYLPEVESQMFAAKWNIQHLRKVVEFFVSAPKQVPLIPQNFAQALQLAADQAKQLELAAPKIEFHDSIVNDSQTFSTRDAAKKIQQRPIKFGEWLKFNGYLCLNGRAAQKYIDMGLFVTHTGISESDHAYTQTRMTGKGCAYFNNKLFEVKL